MTHTTNVLIVGASGFCGQGVLRSVSTNPSLKVWAHIRPNSSSLPSMTALCNELGHTLLICPIEDLPIHIKNIEPQIIGSFIGTTKKKMKPNGLSYMDVDYGINQLLISATTPLNHRPLFIYVSSMGVEWHRWSPYLKARHLVEMELKDSDLPHIILRPGILSGPTRTERRPLEQFGAVISTKLAQVSDAVGWTSKGDDMRVLNAKHIGSVVDMLIEDWIKENKPSDYAQTLLVQDIHQLLRTIKS